MEGNLMQTFEIAVTETKIKIVAIIANNEEHALSIAKQQYLDGNIELCHGNLGDVDFKALPTNEPKQFYLINYDEKGSNIQNIVYVTEDGAYNILDYLRDNPDVNFFQAPIIVPEEVIKQSGSSYILESYAKALEQSVEWTEEHKYLWQ